VFAVARAPSFFLGLIRCSMLRQHLSGNRIHS
jgi:hypothetical protein